MYMLFLLFHLLIIDKFSEALQNFNSHMVLYNNLLQYYYDIFHITMLTNFSKVIVRADMPLVFQTNKHKTQNLISRTDIMRISQQ